jgi:hypothetical protein
MVMVFVPTTSAPAEIAKVYKMFCQRVSNKNYANTETHAPRPAGDTTRIQIVGDSGNGAGEGTNRDDGTATGKRQSRSYREANCRCISARMAWTVRTDALWDEVSIVLMVTGPMAWKIAMGNEVAALPTVKVTGPQEDNRAPLGCIVSILLQ